MAARDLCCRRGNGEVKIEQREGDGIRHRFRFRLLLIGYGGGAVAAPWFLLLLPFSFPLQSSMRPWRLYFQTLKIARIFLDPQLQPISVVFYLELRYLVLFFLLSNFSTQKQCIYILPQNFKIFT